MARKKGDGKWIWFNNDLKEDEKGTTRTHKKK